MPRITDVLRNLISVKKSAGPIVMKPAVTTVRAESKIIIDQ